MLDNGPIKINSKNKDRKYFDKDLSNKEEKVL